VQLSWRSRARLASCGAYCGRCRCCSDISCVVSGAPAWLRHLAAEIQPRSQQPASAAAVTAHAESSHMLRHLRCARRTSFPAVVSMQLTRPRPCRSRR
jgi:hypothetical protein